jgi:hypothetical protein
MPGRGGRRCGGVARYPLSRRLNLISVTRDIRQKFRAVSAKSAFSRSGFPGLKTLNSEYIEMAVLKDLS